VCVCEGRRWVKLWYVVRRGCRDPGICVAWFSGLGGSGRSMVCLNCSVEEIPR
jgi:hypothetical protein